MRLAVLRASGLDWDAKAFLEQHSLHSDAVWRAGDRHAGRLRTKPGFNLTIADAASGLELAQQIGDWLRQNDAILQALAQAGVQSELDVGLGAEGPEEFDVDVRLDPSDLSILARSRTGLVFTPIPDHHRVRSMNQPEELECGREPHHAGGNRQLIVDGLGIAIADLLPPDYRGAYGDDAPRDARADRLHRAMFG